MQFILPKGIIFLNFILGIEFLYIQGIYGSSCTGYEWLQGEMFTGMNLYNANTVDNITDGSINHQLQCAFRCLREDQCNSYQYHTASRVCLLAYVNHFSRMAMPYDWFPDTPIYLTGDICRLINGVFSFSPSLLK